MSTEIACSGMAGSDTTAPVSASRRSLTAVGSLGAVGKALVQLLYLKGNVAVYKGLFLELSSSHVIVITVYTFPSVY